MICNEEQWLNPDYENPFRGDDDEEYEEEEDEDGE